MGGYAQLLAKSVSGAKPRAEETLRGHTAMVVRSARELLDHRGEASLEAAGLATTELDRLRRIVLVGAFAHDLGKCSDHFQGMVRRERDAPQLLRHEAATLWLCWQGPLAEYLEHAAQSRCDLVLALCAAAGHHRKFWSRALAEDGSGAGSRMTLLASHVDFANLLHAMPAMTGLRASQPPQLSDAIIEVSRRSNPRTQLESWEDEAGPVVAAHARLLAVAKALVLDADVAGSALPRGGEGPAWIATELHRRPTRARLQAVVEARLDGRPLRPFQEAVAASGAQVTLVRAGCGTGKTVAAYQWAANQHPGKQLWVTYPTTGTATEGFRDYAHNPSLAIDLAARLDHGRAEVDLDVFGLRDDDEGLRDRDRLDALRNWGSEVVTCTVDTVLGVVQNNRKGLYAWPGLCDSSIVFDEIHAYDEALFGALLRFIGALPGIPLLLMTASLPSARLAALRAAIDETHHTPLTEIDGPSDLETLPRYRRLETDDEWAAVAGTLRNGGKVLWVSNTVDRCVTTAGAAAARGLAPAIYHSRFRYRDRVARHGDAIAAFAAADQPALAVTTQVAEMSLDLSADLLVSDLAPVPSLIQRLGRLNRRSTPERPADPKPFVVLDVESPRPYDDTELDATRAWLTRLGTAAISQRALVDTWDQDAALPAAPIASGWLDGGFSTEVAPLREADFGITVLLDDDARRVRSRAVRTVEVALPMGPPRGRAWLGWRRVDGYPVAPATAIAYDPERGGRWL